MEYTNIYHLDILVDLYLFNQLSVLLILYSYLEVLHKIKKFTIILNIHFQIKENNTHDDILMHIYKEDVLFALISWQLPETWKSC